MIIFRISSETIAYLEKVISNSFTVLSVLKLFSYETWFISCVSATVLE